MAVDVQLSANQFTLDLFPFEVDVWRGGGIRHRLDGAESVLAVGIRRETAEALKVGISALLPLREIDRSRVALPDFDGRVADRRAALRQHASRQMGDLADGRRCRV